MRLPRHNCVIPSVFPLHAKQKRSHPGNHETATWYPPSGEILSERSTEEIGGLRERILPTYACICYVQKVLELDIGGEIRHPLRRL